jgi:protein-tyrosine kinase
MSIIENAINKLAQGEGPVKKPGMSQGAEFRTVNEVAEKALGGLDTRNLQGAETTIQPLSDPESNLSLSSSPTSRLVTINLSRLRQAGMITPDSERTQIAEEFRLIKRPLLMNAFSNGAAGKNTNLVMVTSSFPGEGKSFCAINLAISIAMEMDHTVLLVDADVSKPSVPSFLGFKAEKGLMDVLLNDKLDLSDVLLRTNVEKLTILPAGQGHRRATELLASEMMNRLLQELAYRYRDRIIIFDTPPLLASSESRVLASHMGQIVMVVEAEKTTHEALREALHQIDSCESVGLLLNKGNAARGMDYYGYLGNYGY